MNTFPHYSESYVNRRSRRAFLKGRGKVSTYYYRDSWNRLLERVHHERTIAAGEADGITVSLTQIFDSVLFSEP